MKGLEELYYGGANIMDIQIRSCQSKDLEFVIHLMNELQEVAKSASDFIEEDMIKIFEEMEKKPEIYYNVIAEADGIVAGFISVIFYKTLYHNGGTALINELVINQDYRGNGIGKILVQKVKEEAIKRGMDELEVGTEITNKAAQNFYKKCGFDEEFILLGMEF